MQSTRVLMQLSTAHTPFTPPSTDPCCEFRFARLFERAALGIALCHPDGHIAEGNAALAQLLGYDSSELPGIDPWRMHTDDSDTSIMLGDLVRGGRDSFITEKPCRRKDGSEFCGRLAVSLAPGSGRDPSFLIVLLEDGTERHQLEQQLRQAEKMEIIGRLTGGIAHDFNNLLTGFLLYCDLLLTKMPPSDPLRREVEEIRTAGEQGSALTHQILSFSRKQSRRPQPVALNLAVSSTRSLLRRLIGENITLQVTLDPAAGIIFADPSEVRQVLLNLVLNARDALKGGGTIHIQTLATCFPETSGATPPEAVCLIVEDNGCGMSAEARARLFEPFFTTKQPGEGTGMGLATVHRIVTEAAGTIDVASQPGQGTQIKVFFPVVNHTLSTLPDAANTWTLSKANSLSPSTKGVPQ